MRSLPPFAAQAAAAPAATSTPTTPTVEERGQAFRPVQGGDMQSGEMLLVEAYAAIWLIAFALILLSWRRQQKLDGRLQALEAALERARRAKGSGDG
ncbi:CcmD family protein [Chondromyces apiculatus]|uniref:CcmD family protein n=1 Tax=Chondromyces apiculatus DSM 436 TaxID=1192034 RepID=A0A017T6X8_9BACT|nr:CcmD family protein [Chondromyces apiculatus]EYF04346.1 Hypothetical protein CAP_4610 [Chondromyces apiculatus DSM 436]